MAEKLGFFHSQAGWWVDEPIELQFGEPVGMGLFCVFFLIGNLDLQGEDESICCVVGVCNFIWNEVLPHVVMLDKMIMTISPFQSRIINWSLGDIVSCCCEFVGVIGSFRMCRVQPENLF